MTRQAFIEQTLRQIYGGYIPDESSITFNLVNLYLEDACAIAAKQCYKDSSQIESVAYVNNGFYTTFKSIPVTQDENFLWRITLPQIPVGIGKNEGIASLKFKSSDGKVSLDCVPLSMNERGYNATMRRIPNKLLYYSEGIYIYAISALVLNQYTATVTMVSGGDSTDLSSTINVPDDYAPVIVEYIKAQLAFERAQPAVAESGSSDAEKTT